MAQTGVITLPTSKIIAYPVGYTQGWELCPADLKRSWMDETANGFAYRCLPMTIANQAGWVIRCPVDFTAVWYFEKGVRDTVKFSFGTPDTPYEGQILSHFGSGIITFTIPWLFRTPSGLGLAARGIPNEAKINCAPLEGIIETDWSPSTFTMNWRILQPEKEVSFTKGEPICFLHPCELGLLESMMPEIHSLESSPETVSAYQAWAQSRNEFNALPERGSNWQKHYHQGTDLNGEKVHHHRRKLSVRPFSEIPDPTCRD